MSLVCAKKAFYFAVGHNMHWFQRGWKHDFQSLLGMVRVSCCDQYGVHCSSDYKYTISYGHCLQGRAWNPRQLGSFAGFSQLCKIQWWHWIQKSQERFQLCMETDHWQDERMVLYSKMAKCYNSAFVDLAVLPSKIRTNRISVSER